MQRKDSEGNFGLGQPGYNQPPLHVPLEIQQDPGAWRLGRISRMAKINEQNNPIAGGPLYLKTEFEAI